MIRYFLMLGIRENSRKENVDVMIDDDPINIRKLVGNTEVIIFDYPYNRSDEFKELNRAYSWYDIYRIINRGRNDS